MVLVGVGGVDGFGGVGGVDSVGGVGGVSVVGGVSGVVGGGVVGLGVFHSLFCYCLLLFWCCFGVVLVLFWWCWWCHDNRRDNPAKNSRVVMTTAGLS